MKYLIIRYGAIGDVIHSTIIAQAIKNKYPDSEIHFLTSPIVSKLLKYNPFIDSILTANSKTLDSWIELAKLGFKLRKEKYNIIFSLSNTLKNIFICKIANPDKVVKRNKNRVHAVDAFFNSALDVHPDLIKPQKLVLNIDNDLLSQIKGRFSEFKRPYIVFSPCGAHNQIRQGRVWPDEYWCELAEKLQKQYGGTTFITGSKDERDNHLIFSNISNVKVLSGDLTLEESAALYKMSDLFITGDSGPLHIAACFDTKIIALLGSTSPEIVEPYGHKNSYIEPRNDCKYCWNKTCDKLKDGEKISPCMKSIKPEIVLDFINENNLL